MGQVKYIIIGCGIAGVSAAEAIRQSSKTDKITIIYNEPHPLYFRAALSFFKKGEISEEEVIAKPAGWYEDNNIELLADSVTAVNAEAKTVTLESGDSIAFDKLLIAAGSSPFLPPWPGAEREGVYTYRTLDCAKRFASEIKSLNLTDAIVVGGGILGIEMTENFINLGLNVTLLIREDNIAKILFEDDAANIIVKDMKKAGVNFLFEDEIEQIIDDGNRITGIKTKKGQKVDCQIMGVAVGVRSNISFLAGSEIKTDRGIIVNNRMETNMADIYAAGDCCVMHDAKSGSFTPTGTWLKSAIHGGIAGANMVGGSDFFNRTFFNSSHIFRFLYAVIGEYKPVESPAGSKNTLQLVYENGNERYKSIIFRDNRIIGATFLNDFDGLWDIKALIDEKVKIDANEIKDIFTDKKSVDAYLRKSAPALFSA